MVRQHLGHPPQIENFRFFQVSSFCIQKFEYLWRGEQNAKQLHIPDTFLPPILLFREMVVQSSNFLENSSYVRTLKIFQKNLNKCCFSADMAGNFGIFGLWGRKWVPQIFTFWALNRPFLSKFLPFFFPRTLFDLLYHQNFFWGQRTIFHLFMPRK